MKDHLQLLYPVGTANLEELNQYCFNNGVVLNHLQLKKKASKQNSSNSPMHSMKQLLKIEWLKVKNYRTFWILSSLYLISIWGINFIVFRVQHNVYEDQKTGDVAKMFIGGPPYAFPKVWGNDHFCKQLPVIHCRPYYDHFGYQ